MTSSGLDRLDDLLNGGFPESSNVILYGPPFCGKETLIYSFIARGLKEGIPAIIITTDKTTFDASTDLEAYISDVKKYEDEGMLYYVDVYSRSVGINEKKNCAEYVDSPINLNGINMALNAAQTKVTQKSQRHNVVFSSLSTLTAYTNAATTFRFLQIFCGRCKRAGATSLFTLESGMHPENEVQMFKHLMEGVIEFREDDKDLKTYLRVQGLGEAKTRDWVEYRHHDGTLDLLGSFAMGRIR